MLTKVNEIIDLNIRPRLKEHGGDIEVISIKDSIVRIRLTGSCSGCPGASLTVESLIKAELVNHISDIKDIVVDTSVSQELIDYAREFLKRG